MTPLTVEDLLLLKISQTEKMLNCWKNDTSVSSDAVEMASVWSLTNNWVWLRQNAEW